MTKQTTNENFNRANKSRLTATQIILLFISCGLLLAGASIGLTYVAESIIHHVNMDKAFGASLFLGVTTSLPEIISVVGLFYMKNFNAGFSHLLGSNIFNCFVFAIIDAISPKNVFPTYNSYFQKCLVVGGLLISFLLAIALLVHNFHQKHTKNLLLDIALIAILGLIILTYVAYLVLAFLHHTDVISHSQFVQHHNSMLKYSM
jgi:cation:H+ antiporter